MFAIELIVTGSILVAGDVLSLSVGDTFPEQTIVCDTKDAAVGIISTHGNAGIALAKTIFDKYKKDGVCRVDPGPHKIEGKKEYSVVVDSGELAVVEMSHDGKMYWGIMVDVEVH